MKKGDLVHIKILEYVFPNIGIGKLENLRVIIKNVLPDQLVEGRISKIRKNRIEANLVSVLEKASYETEPVCDHSERCGGCLLQTMPYEMQLAYKEKYVKGILNQVSGESFEFQPIIPSPEPFGYRNKMEFSFGDAYYDGPLSLGLHERGKFYEIVTVNTCKLVDSDFTLILKTALTYFQEKGTAFYHKGRHEGLLRHLVVRKGKQTGEILINLVTSSQGELIADEFTSALLNLSVTGIIRGILHTINDSKSDTVQSDETRILYGTEHMTEKLMDLSFDISPYSFFQTNTLGAEKLYETVRQYVGKTKDKIIFDLYTGTGTIAQILSSVAKKVIGVEIVEEAVIKAKENATINSITNCEFIAGDVLKVMDDLEEKPDIIILDPPRSGIHPKAINKIINFKPDTFIYISCNPKTLLVDLPIFMEAGYDVKKAVAVDMFPMTGHTEVVCLLEKKFN
ncbi:MAG: 23S rRNA (Uracil-5-)-methyltransferase RumA [Clostridiales bacterium 38_11]|nr:MAG: 23S rRNA (Uracil-5-)-methyltransferase RumA [Clostridiales bacterium 38_11]HBH11514.1 23S rRNA (uracil(1939)-C(5))-methyltransferase RlmD [Clostridiales bacterium]